MQIHVILFHNTYILRNACVVSESLTDIYIYRDGWGVGRDVTAGCGPGILSLLYVLLTSFQSEWRLPWQQENTLPLCVSSSARCLILS